MSRVLVTGATGFIGRHLVLDLLEEGHEVWGTHFQEGERRFEPAPFREAKLRGMDVRDPAQVRAVVRASRPELVFHLAAQAYPLVSWKDPAGTFEANVLGTIHLFEALRGSPPKEGVLVASSGAIYGEQRRSPISEEAPLLPSNPYGVSKACQDLIAYQYARNFGMRILRARLFGTTGPGKLGDAPGDFAHQIALAEAGEGPPKIRVGNLDTERDISDVRDAIRAFRLILAKGDPEEPVNVGAGRTYRIREILELLLRESRIPLSTTVEASLLRPTDEAVLCADTARLKGMGFSPKFEIRETLRDSLQYWRDHLELIRTLPPDRAPAL